MRRFKCVDSSFMDLTIDKVYDVIKYIRREGRYSDLILIKNDSGYELQYIINSVSGRKLFDDVSTEYRASIIDEILK